MDQDSMEALPNKSTLEINTQLRGDISLYNLNEDNYTYIEYNNKNSTATTIAVTTIIICSFLVSLYYILTKSIP